MKRERYFQKPNQEHINEFVVAVIFDLSGDSVRAFSLDKQGNRRPAPTGRCAKRLEGRRARARQPEHPVRHSDRVRERALSRQPDRSACCILPSAWP
jgi:hypothetical protein